MKHYPFHVSDFNNATRHLNRLERSIYRDLLDLYYETEKQLPIDVAVAARRILANECLTDVERVLNEFFTKTPDGWYHTRCEDEIEAYKANSSQKAMAGKASAAKKALKKQQALEGVSTAIQHTLVSVEADAQRNSTNQSTNQPINQEPIKPSGLKNTALSRPTDVTEATWSDFGKQRKAHKAPLTATALTGIREEVEKAGMTMEAALVMACNRGWRSFKASWLLEKPKQNSPPYGALRAEKREGWIAELTGQQQGAGHGTNRANGSIVIDVESSVIS